jgi:hypothetical protein
MGKWREREGGERERGERERGERERGERERGERGELNRKGQRIKDRVRGALVPFISLYTTPFLLTLSPSISSLWPS